MKIRYYISGHGLGHASRSCQVINTLRRRHRGIAVEVVSDAHSWFFSHFLDPTVPVRRRRLDLGVLQEDSLVMREAETLRAYRDFLPERARIVAEESASLSRDGVDLVAADIPPCAFAAARAAGLPSVGLSNFSWDWIYEGLCEKHPGFEDVLASVRGDYRAADLLLRLPFHGDTSSFGRVEDLPLVARVARTSKEEMRHLLGVEEGKRIGLISFGGFGLERFDFGALEGLADWCFLTEASLGGEAANIRTLPPGAFPYPDLVKAADAVITKPGYGIVSEAIANGTAVLYAERGEFREQALLLKALCRYARACRIDNRSLREGDWGKGLAELMQLPMPVEHILADGDRRAADRLAELVAEAGSPWGGGGLKEFP